MQDNYKAWCRKNWRSGKAVVLPPADAAVKQLRVGQHVQWHQSASVVMCVQSSAVMLALRAQVKQLFFDDYSFTKSDKEGSYIQALCVEGTGLECSETRLTYTRREAPPGVVRRGDGRLHRGRQAHAAGEAFG